MTAEIFYSDNFFLSLALSFSPYLFQVVWLSFLMFELFFSLGRDVENLFRSLYIGSKFFVVFSGV